MRQRLLAGVTVGEERGWGSIDGEGWDGMGYLGKGKKKRGAGRIYCREEIVLL